MGIVKKVLDWLAWIITISLQVITGLIVGEAAFNLGFGKMPISIIQMWLGMTLSIFLIGALAISLRKTIVPKKYLARASFVALGVILPLAILAAIGVALNADNEIINSEPDSVLPILAPIFGMIGFYIPSSRKLILNSAVKKWQSAGRLAAFHTSPIPLLGLAQILFEKFIPSEATELRIAYFFIYMGIWVIILSVAILYKHREFEQ
jgi:hypothetical protein